jgi:hypothetical protein
MSEVRALGRHLTSVCRDPSSQQWVCAACHRVDVARRTHESGLRRRSVRAAEAFCVCRQRHAADAGRSVAIGVASALAIQTIGRLAHGPGPGPQSAEKALTQRCRAYEDIR